MLCWGHILNPEIPKQNGQIHKITYSQAYTTICQPFISFNSGTSSYWGGLDFGTNNVNLTDFEIILWNEHQKTTIGSSMYWFTIGY